MGLLREVLKSRESLVDRLLNYVDDYEIYSHFIGQDIEIGETMHSPIRSSDDFPSFALFIPTKKITRPDAIWFKDLADGRYGDVFKFIYYYAFHHYNIQLEGMFSIVKFIDEQMELGLFSNSIKRERIKVERDYTEHRVPKKIDYQSREFTMKDKEYWGKLFIDTDDLNYFNIKSVRYLLQEEGIVRKEFRKNEIVFIYQVWDKEKLYQPEAPKAFKFRNTCPGDDYRYYQGYPQLKGEAPILIITKSMKDAVVFWKFFNKFLNIPVEVVAPPAESINLPQDFVDLAKNSYKHILCVSDFDAAGVKFAQQCKHFGFSYKFISTKRLLINGKFKVINKDISDFLWNEGYDKTINLLSSWKLEQYLEVKPKMKLSILC